MKIIDSHIRNHLFKFIENPDQDFYSTFNLLANENKERAKKLLIYIDKLINKTLNDQEKVIKYTHIHLEETPNEMIGVIAEFIAIKFFFLAFRSDKLDDGYNFLPREINKINTLLKIPLQIPSVKGGIKKEMRLRSEKKNLKLKKEFLEAIHKINPNASLVPKTLINVLHKDYQQLKDFYEVRNIVTTIENNKVGRSYNLINCDKSRDEIDEITLVDDQYLLDTIENIIVFDCEKKQIHRKFNYKDSIDWNRSSSNFKNLIIFSFNEERFKFKNLKSRLDRIRSRFHSQPKFPEYDAYIITPIEIKLLLNKTIEKSTEVYPSGRVALICDEQCS